MPEKKKSPEEESVREYEGWYGQSAFCLRCCFDKMKEDARDASLPSVGYRRSRLPLLGEQASSARFGYVPSVDRHTRS